MTSGSRSRGCSAIVATSRPGRRTNAASDGPVANPRAGPRRVRPSSFPCSCCCSSPRSSFGLYIFYNQQLANAAREPRSLRGRPQLDGTMPDGLPLSTPPQDLLPDSTSYSRCDAPEGGWPRMTPGAARQNVWGMAPNQVSVSACWSGYVDRDQQLRCPARGAERLHGLHDQPGQPTDRSACSSLGCPAPRDARLSSQPSRKPMATTRPVTWLLRPGDAPIPDDRHGLRPASSGNRRWPAS